MSFKDATLLLKKFLDTHGLRDVKVTLEFQGWAERYHFNSQVADELGEMYSPVVDLNNFTIWGLPIELKYKEPKDANLRTRGCCHCRGCSRCADCTPCCHFHQSCSRD